MDNFKNLFRGYLRPQKLSYTVEKGNVRYLDGSNLKRPTKMRGATLLFAAVVVVVGIILGYFFLKDTVYDAVRQQMLNQQSVEENLSRESATASLPAMQSLLGLPADQIVAAVNAQGYPVLDIAAQKGASGVELLRLPKDVSTTDAALMYAKGFGSLTAQQASLLLNGSVYLSVDDTQQSYVMRYADFQAGDEQKALQTAAQTQGIDLTQATATGTDDSGNTYAEGTLTANGAAYTWRISTIPLSDMYDIKGLPDNAVYVGMRVTAA